MKIGIFTGGTSVRSKNIFTAILRYPTGKHDMYYTSDNISIKMAYFGREGMTRIRYCNNPNAFDGCDLLTPTIFLLNNLPIFIYCFIIDSLVNVATNIIFLIYVRSSCDSKQAAIALEF